MDLEMKTKAYKKKKIEPFYIAVIFLVLSILLTGGLYFYNMTLINENSELDENINSKKSSILELEKNPKIVASNLYNINLSEIRKLEDRSRISLYIDHLIELRRKYNIDFKGFKYSDGILKTQAIAKSDLYGINYKKVAKFIENYRKDKDLSSLFDFQLVKNVKSKDNGVYNVFDIELVLKQNVGKILEKREIIQKELEKKKKEEFQKRREELLKKQELEAKTNSGTTTSGTISE